MVSPSRFLVSTKHTFSSSEVAQMIKSVDGVDVSSDRRSKDGREGKEADLREHSRPRVIERNLLLSSPPMSLSPRSVDRVCDEDQSEDEDEGDGSILQVAVLRSVVPECRSVRDELRQHRLRSNLLLPEDDEPEDLLHRYLQCLLEVYRSPLNFLELPN